MQLAAPPSAMLLLLALVRPLGFPEMPRPISAHVHAHTHTHGAHKGAQITCFAL